MPKNLQEFLTMMDERLWFRMIVCFLPPLVIAKLAGYAGDSSALNWFTTGVLVICVGVYAFWGRLRGLTSAQEEEAFDAEDADESGAASAQGASPEVPAQDQLVLLTQLRTLCQEEERESDRLIAMEVVVNPQLTLPEAISAAITRRRITGRG